jgi:hypothetical protein
MNDLVDLLVQFWFGVTPLGDGWRIYLYGGLFVLAITSRWHQQPLGDSPLQAPEIVRRCPPSLYTPAGLFAYLPSWCRSNTFLRVLRVLVVIGWVCATAGLGGRYAPMVTGLGAFVFHGALAGALGTNHRWVLPVWLLLAAGFVDLRGDYSADAWLSARWGDYPFARSVAHFPSGVVARIALVLAVLTLVAGGISKLRLGGVRWLDGDSLLFYMQHPTDGASSSLKGWIATHHAARRALAITTTAIELGAPLALISERGRIFVLSTAALLHLGIWLTMRPNYLPQAWCYPLCFAPAAIVIDSNPDTVAVSCFLTLSFALLFVTAARGVEWWPLTSIPMYAFFRGPSGDWSRSSLRDRSQAQALGAEFRRSRLPFPLAWSEQWVRVYLQTQSGRRVIQPAGVSEKQWRRLLHRCAADEFAGTPAADVFLNANRELLAGTLEGEERDDPDARLLFVVPISGKDVVLAELAIR